jgi:DNA invertase Pin-like site-specific DNA recombinase
VQWFSDSVTGEVPWDKRPAMRALVERVAVNGIDAVIVHQLDRIARGKSAIFEDFFEIVSANGMQVISVVDVGVPTDEESDRIRQGNAYERLCGEKRARHASHQR